MQGYVHSVESMGLVDGPGVRSVVFLQGCPLRCLYCHNPDTQQVGAGQAVTVDAMAQKLFRFQGYFGQGGGVTVSGGEPLLQYAFVTELFSVLKGRGIHTCLDTAGVGLPKDGFADKGKALLAVTDLVLLDIKHPDPDGYKQITGRDRDAFDAFASLLEETGTPLWLRHVVVPGLTDGEAHIKALGAYAKRFSHVEKIELLPYHTMGEEKYNKLGRAYPLAGTPSLSREKVNELYRFL